MPKKIFTQELEGTRRRGRPRKGWKEEVERDRQVLGVRRQRELVTDREKWEDIVRQAKAHYGLQSQQKKKSICRTPCIPSTAINCPQSVSDDVLSEPCYWRRPLTASHCGGPVSIPGQFMWNLRWTKWHSDTCPSSAADFLSVLPYRCSTFIHSPITNALSN